MDMSRGLLEKDALTEVLREAFWSLDLQLPTLDQLQS